MCGGMEKKMKKAILTLLTAASVLLPQAALADGITVKIDGEILLSPIPAQIVNDRTVLPMRSVFEAFGANVTWEPENKIIFATKGSKFITMQIGNPKMSVQTVESDKNNVIELDTAPFIDSDYTLVPVRAVAEALDAQVDWDSETQTVNIKK